MSRNLSPRQFGDYELSYEPPDSFTSDHQILATHPEHGPVGALTWHKGTHKVSMVDVDPEHQRQGLATAMWEMSQEARPRAQHSSDRTDVGDAWARKVGGRLPRRRRD